MFNIEDFESFKVYGVRLVKDVWRITSAQELIFQFSFKDLNWDQFFTISLWKFSNHECPLVLKVEENKKIYNGFDLIDSNSQNSPKIAYYSLEKIENLIEIFKMLKIENPVFLVPEVVGAFEGGGMELVFELNHNKKKTFMQFGGEMLEFDKWTNYKNKISKKEFEKLRHEHLKLSMSIPEDFRKKHVWIADNLVIFFLENCFEFVVVDNDSEVYFEKKLKFQSFTNWSEELKVECENFYNKNKVWPNLLMASELTFRRIDLAANSKPEHLIKNGETGISTIPEEFVVLEGYKYLEADISFSINNMLEVNKYILIYDSDPDGEFKPDESPIKNAV